ncbi:MAG TPA: hypothetical protein VE781_12760 [Kineosporiaceae bacterium]|nr:hypothetical protein [Kineosporiaceae bacterium]
MTSGEPAPDPAGLARWVLTRPPAPALPAGPLVVGVDGRSGAGKTTLARSLVVALSELGAHAVGVHLDDLYPGWDGLDAVVPVVRALLSDLAGDTPVVVPTWDWPAGRPGPSRTLAGLGPPRPRVVVLEGAGCGARATAPWTAALLWVDADPAVRRARALARDGDTYAPHWQRWADQEEAYAAREQVPARADVVLGTDGRAARVVR